MIVRTILGAGLLAAVLGFAATPDQPLPAGKGVPIVAGAQAFKLDPVHSSVIFRVIHMQAAPFYGRLNTINGTFLLDPENPAESRIDVAIDTNSVNTGNAGRDRHLMGPDFLSAPEFPQIMFKGTKFEKTGEDRWTVTGDLTLRGKTLPVTATVEHTGTADVSPRFGLRSGYEAKLKIRRSDFGVNYMLENGGLGDEVEIIVAAEGTPVS